MQMSWKTSITSKQGGGKEQKNSFFLEKPGNPFRSAHKNAQNPQKLKSYGTKLTHPHVSILSNLAISADLDLARRMCRFWLDTAVPLAMARNPLSSKPSFNMECIHRAACRYHTSELTLRLIVMISSTHAHT